MIDSCGTHKNVPCNHNAGINAEMIVFVRLALGEKEAYPSLDRQLVHQTNLTFGVLRASIEGCRVSEPNLNSGARR